MYIISERNFMLFLARLLLGSFYCMCPAGQELFLLVIQDPVVQARDFQTQVRAILALVG